MACGNAAHGEAVMVKEVDDGSLCPVAFFFRAIHSNHLMRIVPRDSAMDANTQR